MTVSSSTTKVSLSANGTQHSFAYTFKIFAAADLEVIVRTSAGTETVQTNNTNYIVTGAGNANGGNVLFKFNTGDASNAHHDASTDHRPANGTTVIIRRNLTITQGTDYVENDPFPAASHEDALDRLTMVTQQIQEEVDRSIKASTGNTFSGATFTLSATDRANKIFAFDSAGNLAVTQELGTFRGNFAASTAYAVRDLVKDTSTNNIFIVNEAHTSSGSQPLTTNANSAKYTLLVDANSATTSQTAAAASALASANSATASGNSATAAANSLTTFQNQYHGAASSDPTSNLDAGDLYFNTSSGVKVYNGSAWVDVKPTSTEQGHITTVAGISSEVTTVAGLNTTHLSNVSGQASNIGSLGPISSDITTIANISSDVTSLANSLEKTYTVTVANVGGSNVFLLDGVNYPAIEMFRGNTYIFNLNDSSVDGHPLVFKNGSSAYETGVTYFLNGSSATQSNFVNVTTFNAGRSSGDRKVQIEVASTAPSTGLRYYCYVHGNAMGNTITVKDSNVSLVAGSIASVNSTAAALTNINALAASAVITDMSLLGTTDVVADMALLATTDVIADMALLATAAVIEDMGFLGTSANVTAMANLGTSTVVGHMAALNASGVISNINSVGTDISNVNTVASNLSGVNSFAERYRVQDGVPGSDNDIGDLVFDRTANTLKVFGSSGFQNAGSSVNGTSARFTYNISGTPTAVTGSDANGNTLAYDAGFIDVFLNGVKQVNGTDVTVTSGDTVTFASALANGDVVDIVGFGTFNVAAISASNINSGTVPVARLGSSGTRDNTTFLRGDNTFAVVDTTNASNLSTGTLPNARLSSVPNSALANSGITINGSAVALGGSVTLQEDFSWETKTSAFNVSASRGYFVDTSGGAVTATLPASPTAGDTVRFIDLSATFDTNNLTVARNGKKIQGDASDMTVATERAGFALVFSGDTQGWLLMEK